MNLIDQRKLTKGAAPLNDKLNPNLYQGCVRNFLFERYSVAGNTEVMSTFGSVKLKDLKSADRVLTKNSGYRSIVRNIERDIVISKQGGVALRCIEAESLSDELPQSRVIIGQNAKISRYVSTHEGYRKLATLTASSIGEHTAKFSEIPKSMRLNIPVFEKSEWIYVCGIYVQCPSIDDIETEAKSS